MGHYAQNKRRGGGGVLSTVDAAPFLIAGTEPDISWTWSGTDPDTWNLEEAANVGGPWTTNATPAGSDRSAASATEALFYRISGEDAIGGRITPFSNIVVEMP